jgi:hypothetical protein
VNADTARDALARDGERACDGQRRIERPDDPVLEDQRFLVRETEQIEGMVERPVDPRRPGKQSGDLTDVKPASKIGRPGFAMAVVALIVIAVVALLILH